MNIFEKFINKIFFKKEPLYLSIDSRIQNIFHEQLTGAMNKYNVKSALGMLMNAKTGENTRF